MEALNKFVGFFANAFVSKFHFVLFAVASIFITWFAVGMVNLQLDRSIAGDGKAVAMIVPIILGLPLSFFSLVVGAVFPPELQNSTSTIIWIMIPVYINAYLISALIAYLFRKAVHSTSPNATFF
jgi:hypothetical protein